MHGASPEHHGGEPSEDRLTKVLTDELGKSITRLCLIAGLVIDLQHLAEALFIFFHCPGIVTSISGVSLLHTVPPCVQAQSWSCLSTRELEEY